VKAIIYGSNLNIEEIFDDENVALDFICEEWFDFPKDDEDMVENIQELRENGVYNDEWCTITLQEVDDNFYIRDDSGTCMARASVTIPTWNRAGLSLEVVNYDGDEFPFQNIEISCGDNVDGSVSNCMTIGGIDVADGALDALEDFGNQIIRIAQIAKKEIEKN
jgi:hypothetical protein